MIEARNPIGLLTAVFANLALGSLAHAGNEPGPYAGRTLLSAQRSVESPVDQPSARPLAEHGAPILGDRVYLGFRFNSALAIEGADLRKPVHQPPGTKDSIAAANSISAPFSERVMATARSGPQISPETSLAHDGNDGGPYAGRTLLSGQPAFDLPVDQAGTTLLTQQGARIAGDRVYLGYRFNSAFAIEGADLRTPAHQLEGTNDSIAVTGSVSAPLSDRVMATAKAGLHVSPEAPASSLVRPGFFASQPLYGLSFSYLATNNVELLANTERLQGHPTEATSALPGHTVLIGARIKF